MSAHDINSASTLSRREKCPGSGHAERGLPDSPTEASERGNRLHAVTAQAIRAPESERIAVLAQLNADEYEAVETCVQEFDNIMSEARQMIAKPLVLVEHPVDLSHLGIVVPGTVDLAVIVPGRIAWIRDWKYGHMWVPASPWNVQLQTYASGIAESFGVEEINAGIVQPARNQWERQVGIWSRERLGQLAHKIRAIVSAALSPDAPLVAGDWCDLCRRRPTCPKRAEVAAVITQIKDPVLVMQETPAHERAALFDRLNLAAKVIRDASNEIEAAALNGTLSIPGYKIGDGRKSRAWADPVVAELELKRLAALKGLTEESVFVREMLSPAGAEKLLGKSKAVVEQMKPLIEEKTGAKQLVRDYQGAIA